MLERIDSGTVLRGASLLYRRLFRHGAGAYSRAITPMLVVAACGLLPACAATTTAGKPDEAYVKAAWAYFKNKCDTEAGEKIYKTFTGVKSVLVVKPLPPATEKDLYDQFWMGDPYSDATPWDRRGGHAAGKLVYPNSPVGDNILGTGFEFVEAFADSSNTQRIKYYYDAATKDYTQREISKFESRFSIAWEDVSTPNDRKYWIAGSRLRILDLTDNSVIAERSGFLIEPGFGSTAGQRRPWLTARGMGAAKTSCPEAHTWSDRWFVLKVLKPNTEGQ